MGSLQDLNRCYETLSIRSAKDSIVNARDEGVKNNNGYRNIIG